MLEKPMKNHPDRKQQRQPGLRLRGNRRAKRLRLSRRLEQKIAQEAKELGLAPNEYLRIALSMSKSFMDVAKTDSSLDLRSVAKIVDSPVWSIVIQSLVPTINGLLDTKQGQSTESSTPREREQPMNRPPLPPPGYW